MFHKPRTHRSNMVKSNVFIHLVLPQNWNEHLTIYLNIYFKKATQTQNLGYK